MTQLTMEEVDGALGKMGEELASLAKQVAEANRKLEDLAKQVNQLSIQVRSQNRKQ